MGKGDKKSKRGKINNGSYGKRRLRKASKPAAAASEDKAKN
ncbi:30S ribosomal protein THX [uncultured Chryseobacterium sp.]|nr:30S ribosomal protein THX [uncultured Chryseobacterium sp.]